VREVEASVVAVLTESGEGSGVVWAADGVVVTNHHVAGDARSIEVGFADGRRVPATLIATDPLTDWPCCAPSGRPAGGDLRR
jgi:S1-C subfamily serine protease